MAFLRSKFPRRLKYKLWIQNLNFRWIHKDSAATVDSAGVNGKGYIKEQVPAWPNG